MKAPLSGFVVHLKSSSSTIMQEGAKNDSVALNEIQFELTLTKIGPMFFSPSLNPYQMMSWTLIGSRLDLLRIDSLNGPCSLTQFNQGEEYRRRVPDSRESSPSPAATSAADLCPSYPCVLPGPQILASSPATVPVLVPAAVSSLPSSILTDVLMLSHVSFPENED